MHDMRTYLPPVGRLLMSGFFIWSGITKLLNPAGAVQYFTYFNVPIPSVTVWLVVLTETAGGLAILLGFMARWAAAMLAVFCLIVGFGVHLRTGDPPSMSLFYKYLVMAGGLFYVLAFGPGKFSLDKEGQSDVARIWHFLVRCVRMARYGTADELD